MEYDVRILGWDREGINKKDEERASYIIHRCQLEGRYGVGVRNIFSLIQWWIYEFFWLSKQSFDVVHACDFDSYIPALLVAKLKRKKIVYDIFDFYAEMLTRVPQFLKIIIRRIDLFFIRYADGVILADEYRKEQIADSCSKRTIVVYNTPPDFLKRFQRNREYQRVNGIFTIGYIGLISEKGRGLDDIVDVISQIFDAHLFIGGYGDGKYKKILGKKIAQFRNIQFLGQITPYLPSS